MAIEVYNDKHIAALARAEAIFLAGTPVSVAWSGGKDSSVLLDLTLAAAVAAKEQGAEPYLLITNGDTGVENAEIAAYVEKESKKIIEFAQRHELHLDYHVATPNLNDSWAVRIISGRALPSFPQTNHDCAVDWKVLPMARLRKHLMKSVSALTGQEVITFVGTRYSESAARAGNMAARGDSHERPSRNNSNDLTFSIIADWDTDDVWEWVGMTRSGLIDSYSDFDDLRRIYADGGGTSCAVVSDALTEGMKKARGGCGARFGCMTCTAVKDDKSLRAMIELDESRYGYMAGPNKLREFIVNTQWDFSRRQWLGRTVDDNGLIAIRPDTYSPNMCLELLRYALSIDADERRAARDAFLPEPRFELIPIKALIAIDAIWSLQGLMDKPFQAIKEFIDIEEKGLRYPVPTVAEFPRAPMPATRYLSLGGGFNQLSFMDGMRDVSLEMLDSGCRATRTTKSGKLVMDTEISDTFDVNIEGACLAFDYELEHILEMHESLLPAAGYKWWLRMGIISLSPQQVSLHDGILMRTAAKAALGLTGQNIDLEAALVRMGAKPIPPIEISQPVKLDELTHATLQQVDLFDDAQSMSA